MKIQMKKNENNMKINYFDDFQSVAAKNFHRFIHPRWLARFLPSTVWLEVCRVVTGSGRAPTFNLPLWAPERQMKILIPCWMWCSNTPLRHGFFLDERRAQTFPGSLFLKDPWKSKTIVEEEPVGIVDEITLGPRHPISSSHT